MPWKWLNSLLKPCWDWLQVEVTTCCNAACLYCPRTAYQDRWPNRHLSLETFSKLLPAFPRTSLVYLQGWGEPFLHPDFFTMAALAKDAGCQVGTTTNGMLLDVRKIEQLVELEVEVVAFSLAGIDEKNDHFRHGTSLSRVLAALESFRRVKERYGRVKPEIHIAYMLLHSCWPDLESLPLVLEGLGVSQVVISTLDFVPARELSGEAIRPRNLAEYEGMQARLQAVAEKGADRGLKIHHHVHLPGIRRQSCPESPGQALVVGADGSVSPCVFTNLPPGTSYFAGGREISYQPLSFGNINALSLADIWNSKDYVAFRRFFKTGGIPASCLNCSKL